MRILGLSSDGLLGYEAPRSGAFRNLFGPGGTLFGRRDIPVSPQGDTPPQMCFEGLSEFRFGFIRGGEDPLIIESLDPTG